MAPKQNRTVFTNFSTRLDLDTDERLRRLQIAMDRPSAAVLKVALRRYERALFLRFSAEEKADYLDGILDRDTLLAVSKRPLVAAAVNGFAGNAQANK